jgi:hypothetical protein
MELKEWLPIISLSVFIFICVIFYHLAITAWQPKLTTDSAGSQLITATDVIHGVICYRFAYHDGIHCFKNNSGH